MRKVPADSSTVPPPSQARRSTAAWRWVLVKPGNVQVSSPTVMRGRLTVASPGRFAAVVGVVVVVAVIEGMFPIPGGVKAYRVA